MSINILIDSNKKVISYHGTDIQLKTVDNLPEKPQYKAGFDFVPYFNEEINKVIYKEIERPLSTEEEYQKKLEELNREIEKAKEQAEKAERQAKIAKSQSLTALQAVGELAEEKPAGTE